MAEFSFAHYLECSGLQHFFNAATNDIKSVEDQLKELYDASLAQHFEDSTGEQARLLHYTVPLLGPDGSCARKKPAPEKFHLNSVYPELTDANGQMNLLRQTRALDAVVEWLQQRLDVDWIGIYLMRPMDAKCGPALVKHAYRGEFSKAIFPLTDRATSNNAAVGYSGRAVVVQDVREWNGPYYICDANVLSECCAPIYDHATGNIIGIIDAEDSSVGFFTDERITLIAEACYFIGMLNRRHDFLHPLLVAPRGD